jgi:hypothetical protein
MTALRKMSARCSASLKITPIKPATVPAKGSQEGERQQAPLEMSGSCNGFFFIFHQREVDPENHVLQPAKRISVAHKINSDTMN